LIVAGSVAGVSLPRTEVVEVSGVGGIDPVPRTKAERTRAALRAAALRRFVDDGFDGANVADIAADVGVTERTFYRHFATKDEVLFGDLERRLGWLRVALHSRPADENLVDSTRAALLSYPDDPRLMLELAKLRESLLSRERIARYLRELQSALAQEIRRAARVRLGDAPDAELRSAVHAEVLSAAVFAALSVWTDDPSGRDLDRLARLTEDALALVRGIATP
jgi:AcrR family transcriptional regulator